VVVGRLLGGLVGIFVDSLLMGDFVVSLLTGTIAGYTVSVSIFWSLSAGLHELCVVVGRLLGGLVGIKFCKKIIMSLVYAENSDEIGCALRVVRPKCSHLLLDVWYWNIKIRVATRV
jgi:hypothetical protein